MKKYFSAFTAFLFILVQQSCTKDKSDIYAALNNAPPLTKGIMQVVETTYANATWDSVKGHPVPPTDTIRIITTNYNEHGYEIYRARVASVVTNAVLQNNNYIKIIKTQQQLTNQYFFELDNKNRILQQVSFRYTPYVTIGEQPIGDMMAVGDSIKYSGSFPYMPFSSTPDTTGSKYNYTYDDNAQRATMVISFLHNGHTWQEEEKRIYSLDSYGNISAEQERYKVKTLSSTNSDFSDTPNEIYYTKVDERGNWTLKYTYARHYYSIYIDEFGNKTYSITKSHIVSGYTTRKITYYE